MKWHSPFTDAPVTSQIMAVAVVVTCFWFILDEASGERSYRDEAVEKALRQAASSHQNGTRYYNGYGEELTYNQAYRQDATGSVARTIGEAGTSIGLWALLVSFVAWRLRGRTVSLTSFLPIALMTLILFLSMVTLYLVWVELQDPLFMSVHVVNPPIVEGQAVCYPNGFAAGDCPDGYDQER